MLDPETSVMTTGNAVVTSLCHNGIDTVYGLPGAHNDHLFNALYEARDAVRVVHTRHEQTSAYMALGAALVTGKPQVCAVVPGPGLLNASGALLTAYGMNAPVLGLVGQIPQPDIDRGFGVLHELPDQIGLCRHFTKFAARIKAPFEAPGLVHQALTSALSGRQRPVVLECGMDVWGEKGAVLFPEGVAAREKPPVDEDLVERAARILGRAKSPLIVVGGGASDAGPDVLALAEMLQAPVVSFRRGRGVIPTSHPLAVSLPVGHRLWKQADAVLAIGTRFFIQQTQWGIDGDLKVIRLDIDPEEPNRMRKPDVALVGDAGDYVAALLRRLPAHNPVRPSRTEEMATHQAWLDDRLATLEPQVSYLRAIRAVLPVDGIFVDEVTQVGFASRIAFPVERPRTYLSPGYQDTLGWGYGVALGAKVARPAAAVVSIAGDGGIMYQIGELATAVHHNIGVVCVIFDNGQFGNVKRIQATQFDNHFIASDLSNPDFVRLAESFGCAGFRARTPAELEQALAKALSLDAPAIIHVPCGDMPSPWDMIQMPRIRG